MPKTPWATVQDVTPRENLELGYQFQDLPDNEITVPNVQAGMFTRIPRDQVPAESARDLEDARVRDYWTGRRPGTASFGPAKPDSNEVLKVITFIREDDQVLLCRITASSFHVSDGTTWQSFSILDAGGGAATFPTGAKISVAQAFDDLYLADGTNPVWRVDFNAGEVRQIEGAPKAHFITTFAERIIAGNVGFKVGGLRPNSIAWPVNADPLDWTGLGSGREDLAETDIGNHISGVIGFEAQMILMRRKSIVHVTRQPFADNPFRISEFISGLGCDMPYTIAKIPNGIIFADQRTRDVYLYSPGSRPQPIASPVNRDIVDDLINIDRAEATYDPYEKEYHLGIIETGDTDISKVWVFNIEKRAWSYDSGPVISTLGIVSVPGGFTIIDDLVGDIDSQNPSPSGTIDDYAEEGGFQPTLFKGTTTGEVLEQSYAYANDWDATQFELVFQSPNIGALSRRRTLKQLIVAIEALATGDYSIENSNDEDAAWRNTKTVTLTATGRQRIQLKNKSISGDDLYWRVRATAPQFRLINWTARVLEKGLQHQ